jgi:hypothetical protein
MSRYSWMTTGQILELMYQANPEVTSKVFGPGAFSIGLQPDTPPFTLPGVIPVLKYSSYAQFASDVANYAVTYDYGWVAYDCEYWAGTPEDEYNNPVLYMQKFTELAHSQYAHVMLTPARDLALAPGTVMPYTQGNITSWYEDNNIAGHAAATGAEIVEIQTQALTLTPSEFTSFWNTSRNQVHAASSSARVFGGVSTNYGTGQQMAGAALSISSAGGYWLNGTVNTIPACITALTTWLNLT